MTNDPGFGAEYLEAVAEEGLHGAGASNCYGMKDGGYYCVSGGRIYLYIEA